MQILIINGPNLNMLAYREKIYGNISYEQLCNTIYDQFSEEIVIKQSNYEGEIIEWIHSALNQVDAIIINAAAFTHYSYAIADALRIFNGIKVEVHLTDINKREAFRKVNVLSEICEECFMGEGINSYIKAINYIKNK